MLAIYKREMQGYFFSPIAYVFMAIFLVLSGIMFAFINIFNSNANFNSTLGNLMFLFMFTVPILTMRLLSEERKNKTDQLLLTSPLSITKIVMGKYFAAVTVFLVTLVITLIYPLILTFYGTPSMSEIFTGYIGFFCVGAALIAVGVFISALCENQITSAIITWGVLFIMWLGLGGLLQNLIKVQWLIDVLNWFSVYTRFNEAFGQGLLSLTHIFYFISFAAVFVFLTIRSVESRRWREV